ncbi:MAG: helicase-related protein, partial [Lachnospiraceae bacterium]|nr:helicase-related protein [Lachnospiraceae bacterium]
DQIFFGTETAYYIDADEGYLCRITDEYYKQMEPVLRQAKFGGAEFEIGRNNLQEFYYNVLPMLDEYADVTEKNSKQIEQYLLPETRFAFYLDAQDNDVDCKVTAKYGDKEYSCFDILKKRTSELEKCRVKIKEQEIMYRMENLFPVKDIEYETKIVKYEDKDMTQRLQKMVKPFILRRLKTDVLKDLPDKLEETRVVKFDGEQQKLYDAQVVHMKEEIAKNSEEDFNKNKLKILAELTRIEADHKILLFSQFTSMLKIIEERLLEKGIRFYKITGATSKKDRIGMVKQFNDDDTPVFLISLKAGGVGLNLTGADMVIHYDPWWNVAVQNQATDRAHRIGQTKKVTVYKMIAKGTIEEKIVKLQETKKDLADSIISGENIGISNLSKEDLMELLGI